jgi:DNA-binding IscR family transcriptional regulator
MGTALAAMLELSAVDDQRRATTEEIAKRTEGPDVDPKQFKEPVADLKRRGLINSTAGRGGGCRLTAKGMTVAQAANQ